jgi:hypothetical protein
MSFIVQAGDQEKAQKIIDDYFEELYAHGPAGMRSQCYASNNDDRNFIHIKTFKRDSIANSHFRSAIFLNYQQQLATLCGEMPVFSKLNQQQTFESIY